jgi:hypothetical protein
MCDPEGHDSGGTGSRRWRGRKFRRQIGSEASRAMLDDVDHTCSAEMTTGITERPTYLDCRDGAVPTVSECLIKDSTCPLAPPRPSCRAASRPTRRYRVPTCTATSHSGRGIIDVPVRFAYGDRRRLIERMCELRTLEETGDHLQHWRARFICRFFLSRALVQSPRRVAEE